MDRRVILVKESMIKAPGGCLTSCRVRHPKTNEETLLLLNAKNDQILELIKFGKSYQSWIVDDLLLKDGSLLMVTAINPLYFLLPYLKKRSLYFMDMESILEDEEFPDLKKLKECCSNLETFADTKDVQGSTFYRYNESKTTQWLKCKILHVAKALEENEIHIPTISTSSGFVQSSKVSPKEDFITHSWEMISEYLDGEVSSMLKNELDINLPTFQDETDEAVKEPPSKKMKLDDPIPLEDYSKHNMQLFAKAEKLTAAQKKLKTASCQGMKSISSFFKGSQKKS